MKTIKKSLSILLTVLMLFGAVSMCASAAEVDYCSFVAWDIDSHGVMLLYTSDVLDKISSDGEVEIYCTGEEPMYGTTEFKEALADGKAELVGVVSASNLEIIEYDFYGMPYHELYIKPTFDFKTGGYYHFIVKEGTVVSSDGSYASAEEIYVSAPISSTWFDNDVSFFQKIIDFFRSILEWFKNLFN